MLRVLWAVVYVQKICSKFVPYVTGVAVSHTPEIIHEGGSGSGVDVMTKAKLKNPVTSSNYNNENKHHQHQQRTTWSENKNHNKYFSLFGFGAFRKSSHERAGSNSDTLCEFQKVKQLICARLPGLSVGCALWPSLSIYNYVCDSISPYKIHAALFIICWMASLKWIVWAI